MGSVLFDFIVDMFGKDNIFWPFYVLNLIFSVIAYKLGFARELPLLKSVIVYISLAVGVFVVTIFSLMSLPISESLIIISAVLGIYRFRLYRDRSKRHSA